MTAMSDETVRWTPGRAAMVRTVRPNGRVHSVLPVTVVQDDDDVLALYLAPGTVCKRRAGRRGGPRGRLLVEATGGHEDWTWRDHRRLSLWRPGEMFTISLFWRESDDRFVDWYVDIAAPIRRTPLGIDTRDLDLDIVIDPDRQWRWKDEDELLWRLESGYRTAEDVAAIRAAGEQALALLAAGDPRFDQRWVAWRPDPAWPLPSVPAGWDVAEPLAGPV
jgi:uncharacterized protein